MCSLFTFFFYYLQEASWKNQFRCGHMYICIWNIIQEVLVLHCKLSVWKCKQLTFLQGHLLTSITADRGGLTSDNKLELTNSAQKQHRNFCAAKNGGRLPA